MRSERQGGEEVPAIEPAVGQAWRAWGGRRGMCPPTSRKARGFWVRDRWQEQGAGGSRCPVPSNRSAQDSCLKRTTIISDFPGFGEGLGQWPLVGGDDGCGQAEAAETEAGGVPGHVLGPPVYSPPCTSVCFPTAWQHKVVRPFCTLDACSSPPSGPVPMKGMETCPPTSGCPEHTGISESRLADTESCEGLVAPTRTGCTQTRWQSHRPQLRGCLQPTRARHRGQAEPENQGPPPSTMPAPGPRQAHASCWLETLSQGERAACCLHQERVSRWLAWEQWKPRV